MQKITARRDVVPTPTIMLVAALKTVMISEKK